VKFKYNNVNLALQKTSVRANELVRMQKSFFWYQVENVVFYYSFKYVFKKLLRQLQHTTVGVAHHFAIFGL